MKNVLYTLKQACLYISKLLLLFTCCLFGPYAYSQDFNKSTSAFSEPEPEFLSVEQAYQAIPTLNNDGTASFTWQIADEYYLYGHQFGLKAVSSSESIILEFSIPAGKRKYDEIFEKELEVYYQSATLTTQLPTWPRPFELQLSSQGCADAGLCYPPRTLFFTVSDHGIIETEHSTATQVETPSQTNPNLDASEQNHPALFIILIGAVIGGMILNLMPCVFPVLSLKALSLTSGKASSHKINGWVYTAGVVLSFLVVAGIIIIAKSAGTTLGWGFQLQQPAFVAVLVYLFFLLAMNLFGLFEIGTSWMGVGQSLTEGNSRTASFFTGVLAAVVASPCTAPFMATAIGFTITQGTTVTLVVFAFLGFGMALPYLLLCLSPTVAAKLPHPGPWMDTFKQLLSFPLLFTCVWLLSVLGEQTNTDAVTMIVAGLVSLAMAIWLLKKQPPSIWKWLVRITALTLIVFAALTVKDIKLFGNEESHWQDYSPELLKKSLTSNQAVLVDLTADWCITCKINERTSLDIDEVKQLVQELDFIMLRGDWTLNDPEITKLLRLHNRNGVPLYLVYPSSGDKTPEILPQLLTPKTVIEAMKRASAP